MSWILTLLLWSVDLKQSWLCGHVACEVPKALEFGKALHCSSCSARAILKFITMLNKGLRIFTLHRTWVIMGIT